MVLQTLKQTLKLGAITAFMLLSVSLQAATLSPQMIEQFKKLPKAAQERVAKQYGVDVSTITDKEQKSFETSNVIEPRDQSGIRPKEVQEQNIIETEVKKFLKKRQEANEKGLQRFGYDLFEGEPTTFAPMSDVPVPSDYMVGPGDEIKVQLYGKEGQEYELTINREGVIQFPELGPVLVSGLSFTELRKMLGEKIGQQMIGVKSNITMGKLRSIRVFVAGDAYKPGSYTVSSLSSITQALFVAGGVNEIGSLRNIQLKRDGKLIGTFDLYDLLMRGDASGDMQLRSGDVVFIPSVGGLVTVSGEVRRPAIYEMVESESIEQFVAMAGGLKPGAFPKRSSVERFTVQGLKTIISLDLTLSKDKATKAMAGDVISIKNASAQYDSAITVLGAVVRPGGYQWFEGARVNNIFPSIWGDLLFGADLDYGLLIREINQYGDIEVLQFMPGQAINSPDSPENLLLHPRDKLIVFNRNDASQSRMELNRLVKERVAEVAEFTEDSLIGGDLFKAGFEELDHFGQEKQVKIREELAGIALQEQTTEMIFQEKEKEAQTQSVSDEVRNMMANLFSDPELIKQSHAMTRKELLYPIIKKLTLQSRSGSTVKVVGVNGQVRNPGVYPLAKGAQVSSLVHAAGGLTEGAYTSHAELTRTSTSENSSSISHIQISLANSEREKSQNDPLLKERDVLTVMTTPDWQEQKSVEIKGEVKFPGIYNIRRGETMNALIARAGGYTQYAFLPAAVFVRESVRKQEQLEIKKLADQLRRDIATRGVSQDGNVVNYEDAKLMLTDLEHIKAIGRLVVDLKALESGIEEADLQMENEDILYIPSTQQTVAVMGEVQNPATHRYRKGLTLEQYLAMSGGERKRADQGRMYVVKANGSVMLPRSSFWFSSEEELEPGDTLIVPLDTEYKDNLSLWSQITGIIYNSAVALATINKL